MSPDIEIPKVLSFFPHMCFPSTQDNESSF